MNLEALRDIRTAKPYPNISFASETTWKTYFSSFSQRESRIEESIKAPNENISSRSPAVLFGSNVSGSAETRFGISATHPEFETSSRSDFHMGESMKHPKNG